MPPTHHPPPLPPDFRWPRWRYQIDSWATLASAILGFLVFVLPQLGGLSWPVRGIIALIVLFLPLVGYTLLWFARVVLVAYRRVRDFEAVYGQVRQLEAAAETLALLLEVAGLRALPIKRVRFINNRMVLVLQKEWLLRLQVGMRIVALDKDARRITGYFEITEIGRDECYAGAIGRCDEGWERTTKDAEERGAIVKPEHITAFLLPERRGA